MRPGPPYHLAAQKAAAGLGLKVEPKRLDQMGMAFHYGSGIAWGAVYCLMRRAAGMESLGAGIAAGTSMAVILDEFVTPALGFSAPDRDYPAATHVRGLLGHLLYGAALALYGVADRALRKAGRSSMRHA